MNISIRKILGHGSIWVAYYAFLVYMSSVWGMRQDYLLRALIWILPQIGLAYLNMEFLAPYFFVRKRYFSYSMIIIACLAAFALIHFYVDPMRPPNSIMMERMEALRAISKNDGLIWRPRPMRVMRFMPAIFSGLFIIVFSTAYKTAEILGKKEKETSELKHEKLQAELRFLKSQINPHFLFNALHNVYALSLLKSDKTPEVVLKLSDMLRYLLYECKADEVTLSKEIDYIRNYISLIRLKDDNKMNISMDFEEEDQKMIAPMLLIPFIENSFKHSKIEDVENGWVSISLKSPKQYLEFKVQNSIPEVGFTKDEVGGIGLENVKRRLALLYPDRHSLIINQNDQKFEVNLYLEIP